MGLRAKRRPETGVAILERKERFQLGQGKKGGAILGKGKPVKKTLSTSGGGKYELCGGDGTQPAQAPKKGVKKGKGPRGEKGLTLSTKDSQPSFYADRGPEKNPSFALRN